eukprot:UN01104
MKVEKLFRAYVGSLSFYYLFLFLWVGAMYCVRQGGLEAATVITSSESDPYERSFVRRQIFQHKAVPFANYKSMNLMQCQSPG